jgi:hypothetical protein
MRRALASILLALVSFPLIAPLLVAGTDANLPPCCRRNGKHHCSMMSMGEQESSSGPAASANQPKCPYYPAAHTVPGVPAAALPAGSTATIALHFSRSGAEARTKAGYRISFCRSRQKRGPPAPLG